MRLFACNYPAVYQGFVSEVLSDTHKLFGSIVFDYGNPVKLVYTVLRFVKCCGQLVVIALYNYCVAVVIVIVISTNFGFQNKVTSLSISNNREMF